ncbi:MAG: MFS transporter [Alphaproteobacteria bacterium]
MMRQWLKFSVIGFGTLVGPLDSAVNIAFPDITSDLDIPLPSIQWVVICYVLTYASLLLVFGRLGDLFGHQRVFRYGLALCAVSFLFCAWAPELEWLLVARVLQGVGTAMVISCGPALATGLFDETMRARMLGAYTVVFGLGAAIGPSLGGLLVETWGWPAVFWFRFPISVIVLVLSFFLHMPVRERATGAFDLMGAVLLVLSLGLLLFLLSQLRGAGLPPLAMALLGAGTLAAFAWFVVHERRVPAPIIVLGVFRNVDFTLVNLTNIAVNLTAFSIMLLVPYYLTRATSLPITASGVILACGGFGTILAAQLGGNLAHRVGASRIALAGGMCVAMSVFGIGFWPYDAPAAVMVGALILNGIGLGLFQVSCLDLVTAVLPRADRGVAGSLVMVTRTVGVMLGASLLSLLFVTMEQGAAAGGAENAFLSGFQSTFRYTGGLLALFLLASCLRPRLWFARIG